MTTSSGSGNALGEPPPGAVMPVAPAYPAGPAEPAAAGDFERLRELLLGDDRRTLEAARARIAELEIAQKDLGRRLPGALETLRGERSARVARALAEPVSQALGEAVQKNRQSLVDALFPIIGPLIRKAIAEALRNLVADLNSAVESSFTLRGIKWRVEAWRGGVPYAQVVLKHRLAYRIDHVFLIERASGLVLQHESAADLAPLDADAIAGMLTALGDFVGDSIGGGSGTALESMSVGEYLVWIVPGPRANIACFMRGVPPAELRTLLEQRLEEIHAQFSDASDQHLRSEASIALRHELLLPMALLRDADTATAPTRAAPSRWPLLLVVLAAALAIAWFVVSRERWHARIDGLRARLVAQPGFVLTGIDDDPWRSVTVHGLIDPDAQPPLLTGVGIDKDALKLDATGYLSTDDAIIARRAARLLAPPTGVQLAVANGVLALKGTAPDTWIAFAKERAPWVAGVARVEVALQPAIDAVAVARAGLDRLLRTLPGLRVTFTDGTEPAPDADAVVAEIARVAGQASGLAAQARVELALTSVGSTDESGGEATNAHLRAARAQWLAAALAARGVRSDVSPAATERQQDRRGAHLRASVRQAAP